MRALRCRQEIVASCTFLKNALAASQCHYFLRALSSMEARAKALTLYRRILRAHRARLPHDMRQLGDAYVR